ncbi:glucose-6-phosphate dehydrogenase [Cyberlindnera jadinii NRRL Y-1542]|uniref:Glucose-6-phosphate 1-dehydrogenase n=2 Tax=Cyberlindnera jadinii (strain ATCC 18201 / CBS 1600 / BCRC 20928 / JCM 3617 / NBRC 0987 / NRRL Y-1542) TaxID=983966 RepID=A0A1E4S7S8_CYBJN|nr:glucose-6-phosphate dehydrogenase [Cyberlindnera jadinii NRRL Y-1542]ODV75584.1 glucose-6-phosphate dehydrogenase [Cyberlindnera jadinii NRRL Y-1542]
MATQFKENTVIVVFGASGDLAKKKTFPALFGLYREGYLSSSTKIYGYARSQMTSEELHDRIKGHFKTTTEESKQKVEEFLKLVSYISGPYDKAEGFKTLNESIEAFEQERGVKEPHRLFYLALPPSVFITVAKELKENVYASNGITRIIVEKPFGRDLETATELQKQLSPLFTEEEIYRIDHYLGKELVKNLFVLRFGNQILNSSWNKESIKSIQISFKEPFGTEGRGGYFDDIGIIRDVMQNHLLQVLTLLTMDRPASFDPESIRDEKVKVLKAMAPIDKKDIIIGQYTKSLDGSKPAYVDDETVKPGSKAVTFAAMTLHIENERWDGVPIVMRAGKALNEGKVEVRIQYKQVAKGIFEDMPPNELVIRIQPNEAVYIKLNAKTPGLATTSQISDLDLTYSKRYQQFWIPEAYESLIKNALEGDHSNFVRDDELDVSWKLFTPFLNYLESPEGPSPELYPYGSRGPEELKQYLADHGYIFTGPGKYQWPVTRPQENL